LEYWVAEEVKEIAVRLIAEISEHSHLAHAKIAYLFRETAIKNKGKVRLGSMAKFPPKMAAITRDIDGDDADKHDYVFLMEIAHDKWGDMDSHTKEALVDHELCHAFGDEDENTGNMVWSILPHDFEGFGNNIKRYGLWDKQYKEASEAINKVATPDE